MNHYCTYFDSGYLAQGLALWHSLRRYDDQAVLSVVALDFETVRVLRGLGDKRLRIVELSELRERDTALEALGNRPRAEFIFALTPCVVLHLLATQPEIERVLYLDADLYFFGPPAPIWVEFGSGSVYVVPHRYPAGCDDARLYGQYNVGVVGIHRNKSGLACLEWWRERCLESTALLADGERYGDQKYLDEWPRRFPAVVESQHVGINLAPWNWRRHRFSGGGQRGELQVDGLPLVVFHFAQFRRISERWFDSGQLEYGIMPGRLRTAVYGPYWEALVGAEEIIRTVLPSFASPRRGWHASIESWRMGFLRITFGQFWYRVGTTWISGRLGLGRFSGAIMGYYRRWQRRAR